MNPLILGAAAWLASALSLGTLMAQEPSQPTPLTGLARFERQHGSGWTVWNGPGGVPYRVFGPGAQILPAPGVQTLADAREAVERLIRDHGEWLGVRFADMVEVGSGEGFRVLALQYQQLHRGVRVWNSWVDFVFHKGDGGLAVFGSTATLGLDVDPVPVLSSSQGLVRYMAITGWRPQDGHLHRDPYLEIVPDAAGKHVLAWRVEAAFSGRPEGWAIWIDAATGAEVKRESLVHYCGAEPQGGSPLSGTVTGWISPKTGGVNPVGNPPQLLPMPGVLVSVSGVGQAYTDKNGNFSIPYSGTTAVNATISLVAGERWNPLTDATGTPIESQNVSLTPGVPANIVFNPTKAEFTTAQANAVKYAWEIWNYVKTVVPTMTQIDPPVRIQVNINSSCNAYYTAGSINFYRQAGSCYNTAAASVVAHEYGHGIDDRNGGIGSTPRTPSEGMADVCSIYLIDDPVVGRDFQLSGGVVRDARNTLTHPLTGSTQAVHTFGQPYMGYSWDLLTEARTTYGPVLGYQIAELAMFESILANPRDMLDYILQAYVVDDDDSNLNNGTPHIDVLSKAAWKRHFIRPVFHNLEFTHAKVADAATWAANTPITVGVSAKMGGVTQVDLYFDPGTGTFQNLAMTNTSGTTWSANTPAVAAGRVARYYFEAQGSLGNRYRWPAENNASFPIAIGQRGVVLSEGFEAGAGGFTASNGTATPGWVRHTPIGRNYDPASAAGGTFVFGVNRSATDERTGTTSATVSLSTPALNLTGRFGTRLRYRSWLTANSTTTGTVLVNGASVQTRTALGEQDWTWQDLDISAQADNRASVVIRFDNQHTGSDGVGGFTIDDVEVYTLNSVCPPAFSAGAGLAGVNGVPALSVVGEPRIGNGAFAYSLASARASAPAAFVVGAVPASIPILGGVLAVQPDVVLPITTAAAGNTGLPLPVPDSASLIGTKLYAQVGILDAAAVQGLALSNALGFEFCGK